MVQYVPVQHLSQLHFGASVHSLSVQASRPQPDFSILYYVGELDCQRVFDVVGVAGTNLSRPCMHLRFR